MKAVKTHALDKCFTIPFRSSESIFINTVFFISLKRGGALRYKSEFLLATPV